MPENAATAALFGFVLSTLALLLGHLYKRERATDARLAEAHQLVRELNESRVKETGDILRCTRDGINGSVIEIRRVDAEREARLIKVLEDFKPVLERNTSVLARAERVMEAFSLMRTNGHG